MANTSIWVTVLSVVVCLIIGGLLAWAIFPRIETETIEKTVEKPVEKIVEVEKIVTQNVPVIPDYKQQVVDALLAEAAKDAAYRKCSGLKYEMDEIAVKKIYDGYTLKENSDGDTEISDVKVKLNYDDGKCYRVLTCSLDAEQEISC